MMLMVIIQEVGRHLRYDHDDYDHDDYDDDYDDEEEEDEDDVDGNYTRGGTSPPISKPITTSDLFV